MQAVEPLHLLAAALLIVVVSALAGFLAAARLLRRERRARGFFVLGFSCGVLTSAALRARRRGLRALVAAKASVPQNFRTTALAPQTIVRRVGAACGEYTGPGISSRGGVHRGEWRHEIRNLHVRHRRRY